MERRVKQHKLQHKQAAPVFMYGVEIPRNSKSTRKIDDANGNTRWVDAEHLELKQLFEYEFANDKGFGDRMLAGYTRIRCRMLYAVKHDARHKTRFVAGEHLTKEPEESVYNSVVSLRSLRIIILPPNLMDLSLLRPMLGPLTSRL